MKKATDLTLVVRSGYASAVAALNHASAGIRSVEAVAEHISHYLSANIADDTFLAGLTSQEIEAAVRSAMFSASSTLDETNVWGITNESEFAWDYEVFGDVLVATIVSALADSYIADDASSAGTGAAPRVDAFTPDDAAVSGIGAVSEDGAGLAEFTSSEHSSGTVDTQTQTDTKVAATQSTLAEGVLCTEATVSNVIAAPVTDTSTPTDNSTAAVVALVADGVIRPYFSGDYALADYCVTDNFVDDRYTATLSAVRADAAVFSDSAVAAAQATFAEGTARTYFASSYAAGDYNAPENSFEDSFLSGMTSPAWADSAVPVDSIAIALTAAAQDSSSTAEGLSTTIQGYSLSNDYFSGDYATLPY